MHEPEIPLTNLQKRWLKTLLLDTRINFFSSCLNGLEDVESLYLKEAIVYYDQYSDKDPYDNENYIKNLRTILEAMKLKRQIRIEYELNNGKVQIRKCNPYCLEYSMKDDKFRLIALTKKNIPVYKVSKILKCEMLEESTDKEYKSVPCNKREVELIITDENQALEHTMIQFSSYEKMTEKLEYGTYKFILKYQAEDEVEILIRVLSFGPKMKKKSNFLLQQRFFMRILRSFMNKM